MVVFAELSSPLVSFHPGDMRPQNRQRMNLNLRLLHTVAIQQGLYVRERLAHPIVCESLAQTIYRLNNEVLSFLDGWHGLVHEIKYKLKELLKLLRIALNENNLAFIKLEQWIERLSRDFKVAMSALTAEEFDEVDLFKDDL